MRLSLIKPNSSIPLIKAIHVSVIATMIIFLWVSSAMAGQGGCQNRGGTVNDKDTPKSSGSIGGKK